MMDEEQYFPMDRGWAWVVVVGYFFSIFCMVGIAKSFGILLEEFVKYFDISVALAALIMGVAGAVYTIAAPVCIAAGQHFTQRRVVMLGGLIGGLGLSLSGLLFSIQWVILTFGAMYGFGNACLFGNGFVMIGQYFSKRRSLANGLGLSGASLGQFALPPLLQYLLDTYSLQGTLIIIGAMYFNVIACGCLFRPTSFYKKPQVTAAKSPESDTLLKHDLNSKPLDEYENQSQEMVRYQTTSSGSVVVGSVDSLHAVVVEENQSKPDKSGGTKCLQFLFSLIDFTVLKSYVVLLMVAFSFLLFVGHFNFILFLPATASNRGVEHYNKAYLVSITGFCDLCGRIAIGFAGDLQFIKRYKLFAVSSLFCGLSILAFSMVREYWLMAICVGFYGFLGGCYVAITAPVVVDFVGMKAMPKVYGVVLFIQGIGAASGQPLLGAIKDSLGTFDVIHYICSGCMLVGAVLVLCYPIVEGWENKRQPPPDATIQINVDK